MGTTPLPAPAIALAYNTTPRPWKALARALLRRWSEDLPLQNLPTFTAQWSGARAQPAALRSYIELCEDHNPAASICVPPAPAPYYSFTLPPLFIHAMAMPLHLAILSHARFPLPLLGLVHLANRTEMLEPVAPTDALDFECRLDGIAGTDKGPGFTLYTEARTQGRVVWREQSTYLYPVRSDPPRRAPSKHVEFTGEPIAEWEVAADAGRRFAVPVRDFNPIHLSDWSARLLGQRSAIAHGLYSAARCLDVLRQHHPIATPFVLDVQFKRPLPLPARVALRAKTEKNDPIASFAPAQAGAPPLRGSLPPEGAAFSSWGGPAMKKGQRFALQILGTDGTDTGQTHLVGTLKPLRRAR